MVNKHTYRSDNIYYHVQRTVQGSCSLNNVLCIQNIKYLGYMINISTHENRNKQLFNTKKHKNVGMQQDVDNSWLIYWMIQQYQVSQSSLQRQSIFLSI
jgi:hypothetical protein